MSKAPLLLRISRQRKYSPLLTKHGVNGKVSSTKPLSYGGSIIDHFSLTFENGRIIDFHAEEGQDTLERLISMDEGSHYLRRSRFGSLPFTDL